MNLYLIFNIIYDDSDLLFAISFSAVHTNVGTSPVSRSNKKKVLDVGMRELFMCIIQRNIGGRKKETKNYVSGLDCFMSFSWDEFYYFVHKTKTYKKRDDDNIKLIDKKIIIFWVTSTVGCC